MRICDMMSYLFDQNPYMATVLVDNDGIIIFMNETYLRILKLTREEVIGNHVETITPNSRTLVTLKTGKAVVGYNWTVNDTHMIASSLPIYGDNKMVGSFAYSMFLDIWDAKKLVEDLLLERNMYKNEVHSLLKAKYDFADIIGEDEKLVNAKAIAEKIAHHAHTTVMITGESGTGKELFAHAIHNASVRSQYPFVRVNCAAIPETLMEAELFGYEEGAYTGSKKEGKLGKFELANGGTIFLDEIGEMSLGMQSKLLVVLQEQVIERLGGIHPIKLDVRVITATNRDLGKMVQEGTFRKDLYYRLNVFHIKIPALRKRKKDIALLTGYFIDKLNGRLNTGITGISNKGSDFLFQYHWPGNIRELEHVLERAMIIADMEGARLLERPHFSFLDNIIDFISRSHNSKSLKTMVEEYEKKALIEVLEKTAFDKKQTAEYLDIDLSSLYRKLKRYNIE